MILYEKVEAAGDSLTAGDVLGVVDVVDLAVEVQADRIEALPEEEREEYADEFTQETIRLLDDILAKPAPWQVYIINCHKLQSNLKTTLDFRTLRSWRSLSV